MKKKSFNLNKFLDSLSIGHTKYEENEFIIKAMLQKLEPPKQKHTTREKLIKKIGGLALAGSILTTGIIMASNSNEKGNSTPIVETTSNTPNPTEDEIDNFKPTLTLKNGYYYCSTEDVLTMAKQSLIRAEKLLTNHNATPVCTNNGSFYADYFNEYMFAGMAYAESSFRVCDENGTPLTSKDGALGMMQILPKTVDEVNLWLKNTMGVDNLTYTVEDLSDPIKSMDISVLYMIELTKNHGKENCNNPIYTYLDEPFSLERQKELMIALYNNGYTNMIKYAQNGTLKEYLREGAKTNHLNKVIKYEEEIKNEINYQYE